MPHSSMNLNYGIGIGIWMALCIACLILQVSPATPQQDTKALMLQPLRDDLANIDLAEQEADRLANAGIARLEEWLHVYSGVAGYIENVRQRLLERHAREKACHDLYLNNFNALVFPDGKAGLPEFGSSPCPVLDRESLLRAIEQERKIEEADLDRWTKGEVMVAIAGFPDFSPRSLENELAGWRRRIDDAKKAMDRGEHRVMGRPWFFGDTDKRGLTNLRTDIERRIKETEDRLAARPQSVTLREVGFATVQDVDREIENTRRTLAETENALRIKDYRLGRWGDTYYAGDVEKRIAGWQREQEEVRRALNDGVFKLAYPDVIGRYSRNDFQARINDLREKISGVEKALTAQTYKVVVYGVGLMDARGMKDIPANSKDANLRNAAQKGLRDIPVASQVHKRVYETYILLFDQWMTAIQKLSEPVFVRRDMEIHQANEVLGEFDRDFSLTKARYERRLAWLERCRQSITGKALPQ
jgi:hypothetical protein